MKIHAVLLLIFAHIALSLSSIAQHQEPKVRTLESLINERLGDYPLSPDNRFRLSSYCELKGQFEHKSNALIIDFGAYGSISFYEKNFILKTPKSGVFHMDRGRNSSHQVLAMNETIESIFEQIMLLSNHESDPDLVAFVDEHLSRKNMEPFYKIFVRHILVKYGRYNAHAHMVEFRTEWLPDQFYSYLEPGDKQLVRKTISPLRMRLDAHTLRESYIKAGGTVFIENVNRDVPYASGEEYGPNVTAFKVFAQRLFVQTTQYITTAERRRIKEFKQVAPPIYFANNDKRPMPAGYASRPIPQNNLGSFQSRRGSYRGADAGKASLAGVKPLYQPKNWIPMMLGILRAKKIDISDRELIQYFKSQPYYPDLYKQLTKEEKEAVDRQR